MTPKIPLKLPAKGVAILFGVSEQRISQLKRKGLLTPDAENMYETKQAIGMRGFQMSEHGVRVVNQMYSNGTGQLAPAKVTPISIDMSPEDMEALGIDTAPTIAPSPNSAFAANERLRDLKEQTLQANLDRARTRADKDRGILVEREQVLSSHVSAGALIANILQNLPAEIAAIFASPDVKTEVRAKVQTRVDQIQHALYSALRGMGESDAQE